MRQLGLLPSTLSESSHSWGQGGRAHSSSTPVLCVTPPSSHWKVGSVQAMSHRGEILMTHTRTWVTCWQASGYLKGFALQWDAFSGRHWCKTLEGGAATVGSF